MIWADAAPIDWGSITNTGAVGVMLLGAVYALRGMFVKLIDSLEANGKQARDDLAEERKSRQAHEAAMAKVLGEIVEQLKSVKCQGPAK